MARVVILVKLTAPRGRRDDLVAALQPVTDAAAREPGTETFALFAARDDPDVLYTHEVYADDAALQAHRANPDLETVTTSLQAVLAGAPEVTYLTPLT